jgi:hypothetical protein
MTSFDRLSIINESLKVLENLFRPPIKPNTIIPTVVTVVSEMLLDSELQSLGWFSDFELKSYNSLDGVELLEKKVMAKIRENTNRPELKNPTEWNDIFETILDDLLKKGKIQR